MRSPNLLTSMAIHSQQHGPASAAHQLPLPARCRHGDHKLRGSALPQRLLLTPRTIGGAPVYLIQQEYCYTWSMADSRQRWLSFSVVDNLPAGLDFAAQVTARDDIPELGNT